MIRNGTYLAFAQWLAYQVAGNTLLLFNPGIAGTRIGVEQLAPPHGSLIIPFRRPSQNVARTFLQKGFPGLACESDDNPSFESLLMDRIARLKVRRPIRMELVKNDPA